jgi:hypothetical protein
MVIHRCIVSIVSLLRMSGPDMHSITSGPTNDIPMPTSWQQAGSVAYTAVCPLPLYYLYVHSPGSNKHGTFTHGWWPEKVDRSNSNTHSPFTLANRTLLASIYTSFPGSFLPHPNKSGTYSFLLVAQYITRLSILSKVKRSSFLNRSTGSLILPKKSVDRC